MFSDGYADQFGGVEGRKFLSKKFRDLLLSVQEKSMSEQQEIIDNTMQIWQGEREQVDDILIIGVRL